MPHRLTVSSLEVMRSSVSPHIDTIEVLIEMKVKEEPDPYLKDEVEIMLIRVVGAEEIKITTSTYGLCIVIFEYNDTILHVFADSRLIGRHGRSEIHQYK